MSGLIESFKNTGKKNTDFDESVCDSFAGLFGFLGDEEFKSRLCSILEQIGKSKTGDELIQAASLQGCSFSFVSGLNQNLTSLCQRARNIVVDDSGSDARLLFSVVTSLKKRINIWHLKPLKPYMLGARSYLMQAFALEADAFAHLAQICWELKGENIERPWQKFEKSYKYISKVYAKACDRPANKDGRQALFECFKAFYRDRNLRHYYENGFVDSIVALHSDKVSDLLRIHPRDIVKNICQMKSGGNYFKANPKVLESVMFLGLDQDNLDRLKQMNEERKANSLNDDLQVLKIPTCLDADTPSFLRAGKIKKRSLPKNKRRNGQVFLTQSLLFSHHCVT